LVIEGTKPFLFESKIDEGIGFYFFGEGAGCYRDEKVLTVSTKKFWSRFRARATDTVIKDYLVEPAARLKTDMQAFLKDSLKFAPKRSVQFIQAHLHHGDDEKTPKGMKKITLRTQYEQYSVFVGFANADRFSGSYSLSELEYSKPEGRAFVDALLSVQDKSTLKQNIKGLQSIISGSYSDKRGTVVEYAGEELRARKKH